jgi:hypothetical protein
MCSAYSFQVEKVIILMIEHADSFENHEKLILQEVKSVSLPKNAYFKGKIVPYSEAKIGVLTHALNYGTAAFGGLRAYWNGEEEQLFIFRAY